MIKFLFYLLINSFHGYRKNITVNLRSTHYLGHCGVYLECGQCHQKFWLLQSFRGHDSKHLDSNMFNLVSFMGANKWCDHYIEYIESTIISLKKLLMFVKYLSGTTQKYELFYNDSNSCKAKECFKLNLD